jgi:hypothetical protein
MCNRFCRFGIIAVLSGAFFSPAIAADMPLKAQPIAPAVNGPWLELFGGYVASPDSSYGYAGAVAAINRNLNKDGWLFRIAGGAGRYKYNIVPGMSDGVDFQTGEIMVGYQTFIGTTRISGYVGPNVEDHHNNTDPLAIMNGTKWGIKGQGEIFAPLNQNWFLYGMGSFSTVWNNYFVMGKAGYNISPIVSIGPEVIQLGNERFDSFRTGPFVQFNVTPSAQLIFSGGYAWDERKDSVNDHSGAYGSVHVRATF